MKPFEAVTFYIIYSSINLQQMHFQNVFSGTSQIAEHCLARSNSI